MIVGVGVDIIEVDRVARAAARRGRRFLDRVFAPEEAAVCLARRQSGTCLAARFAAKEATMKALGCGWGPVGWTDIVVERSEAGPPTVRLRGGAVRVARERGVREIHLSIAHVAETAIAYAVAVGDADVPAGR